MLDLARLAGFHCRDVRRGRWGMGQRLVLFFEELWLYWLILFVEARWFQEKEELHMRCN